MARIKKDDDSKREPPFQLRPGTELGQLVRGFAAEHALHPNEACKCLIGLAVTEMDCRYFGLVHELAKAMGGMNSFIRACIYIRSTLEGAALAADRSIRIEPKRSLFILKVIRDFLKGKGLEVQTQELRFLSEKEGQQKPDQPAPAVPSRKKRTVRVKDFDLQEHPTSQANEGEGQTVKPEWPPEEERQPQRIRP